MERMEQFEKLKELTVKFQKIDELLRCFNSKQLDDVIAILENLARLAVKDDITQEERSAIRVKVLQCINNIENKNCL